VYKIQSSLCFIGNCFETHDSSEHFNHTLFECLVNGYRHGIAENAPQSDVHDRVERELSHLKDLMVVALLLNAR
jgi:hypothetical protein